MTDTFVCGECELEHKDSALKIVKFTFPTPGKKFLEFITVDVNLCTSCFMNGGLSKHQEERIKSRVVQQIEEKQ